MRSMMKMAAAGVLALGFGSMAQAAAPAEFAMCAASTAPRLTAKANCLSS